MATYRPYIFADKILNFYASFKNCIFFGWGYVSLPDHQLNYTIPDSGNNEAAAPITRASEVIASADKTENRFPCETKYI